MQCLSFKRQNYSSNVMMFWYAHAIPMLNVDNVTWYIADVNGMSLLIINVYTWWSLNVGQYDKLNKVFWFGDVLWRIQNGKSSRYHDEVMYIHVAIYCIMRWVFCCTYHCRTTTNRFKSSQKSVYNEDIH